MFALNGRRPPNNKVFVISRRIDHRRARLYLGCRGHSSPDKIPLLSGGEREKERVDDGKEISASDDVRSREYSTYFLLRLIRKLRDRLCRRRR